MTLEHPEQLMGTVQTLLPDVGVKGWCMGGHYLGAECARRAWKHQPRRGAIMSCPVDTSDSEHSQHLLTEMEEQNDDDCCHNTTSIGAWIDDAY